MCINVKLTGMRKKSSVNGDSNVYLYSSTESCIKRMYILCYFNNEEYYSNGAIFSSIFFLLLYSTSKYKIIKNVFYCIGWFYVGKFLIVYCGNVINGRFDVCLNKLFDRFSH